MNIAAYCRVSTDKADQLNSLDAQKEFFTQYTARTGDRLVRLYADEGISGVKIKNRREFLRLLSDAELGLFDAVVVKDISRFARNTVDLLQSIRKLKSLGIETMFLTSNMTSIGNSEFVLTIFGALAQEESANTSGRVKFGKRLNAEKGRVPNLVYGYDKTAGDYFTLAVNAREAEIIDRIFTWYTDGGLGAAKIAQALNEQGVYTKRRCMWSQNAVRRILTNELYTGKVINGKQEITDFLSGRRENIDREKWITAERPELKIIERERFERAQEIMKDRRLRFKSEHERHSSSHLFSSLIKCAGCGWSYRRIVRVYKRTYIRWVCSRRNEKGAGCCGNGTAIDEAALTAALEEYFRSVVSKKKNAEEYIIRQFKSVCTKCGGISRESELNARLSRLYKIRGKYMDMYTDDLISRDELNEKLGGIREEIKCAERELSAISGGSDTAVSTEEVISDIFATPEKLTDISILTNAQIKKIIARIEVGETGAIDVFLKKI